MSGNRRLGVLALAVGIAIGGAGCMHGGHGHLGHEPVADGPAIAVPPPGAVPRELDKITLPPYVIEAPDQLLIEVIQRSKVPKLINGVEQKDAKGETIMDTVTDRLPVQPVSGQFQVRLDGTVGLGFWGSVPVSGLTLEQAAAAVRAHLLQQDTLKQFGTRLESLTVIVDVIAYNSKRYYIIIDGGGPSAGEQMVSFPITGSETVMDAMSNIGGLSDVSSRRNIWVARRTPHPGQPWQILPVDWIGMTQHGITYTNYQIMPGDRIYVKAQRLVSIDRTLARLISPVERAFGITLLGSSTVNQIKGVGLGFNNQ
ncbi:MAG: polysaccharide biosynthesis/export family protein [Planctomycetes bacterium]|nr:polysaccharide biosynthesis/export family protein [Planctomycetota bacterium]